MGKLDEVAESLSVRFQKEIPNVAGGKTVKLSEKEISRRLELFYAAARESRKENKLWVVGWARVVLRLKRSLLDAGYPPELVSRLITSTLLNVAKGK